MTTIAGEVRRLKWRVPELISPALVDALLRKLPHAFRDRLLTPLVAVQLLVLRVLERKSVAVIEREILPYVLVYNLVAREIRSAAARQTISPIASASSTSCAGFWRA